MPARNTIEDVWEQLDMTEVDDCWLWMGALNGGGYGHVRLNGQRPLVHRLIYELLVGPVPEGLELDHLCKVRHCANPSHLEPVTHRENVRRGDGWAGQHARKTQCPRGHDYDYTRPSDGARMCRTCNRDRMTPDVYARSTT